jgi:hypothetical protein
VVLDADPVGLALGPVLAAVGVPTPGAAAVLDPVGLAAGDALGVALGVAVGVVVTRIGFLPLSRPNASA